MSTSDFVIQLNGEPRSVRSGETILSLLESLGRDPRTVAVEHNGVIVRSPSYDSCSLGTGDQVEIVHFVQGGC